MFEVQTTDDVAAISGHTEHRPPSAPQLEHLGPTARATPEMQPLDNNLFICMQCLAVAYPDDHIGILPRPNVCLVHPWELNQLQKKQPLDVETFFFSLTRSHFSIKTTEEK